MSDHDPDSGTETAALFEATKKAFAPTVVTIERGTADRAGMLLIPAGMQTVDTKAILDKYLPAPERRRGTAAHTDLKSFIAHVQRFADQDSAIFADVTPAKPGVTVVFNYHRQGPQGAPQWGDHRATYSFPLADEWKLWLGKHNKTLDQATFAAFIEDQILGILDPATAGPKKLALAEAIGCKLASPAKLLELSRGLVINENASVGQVVNLATGEGRLVYTTQHTDGSGEPLNVPGAFVAAVPVFTGADPFQLLVRLRYKLDKGSQRVVWTLVLHDIEKVLAAEIDAALAKIAEETQLPVFRGTPEV